MKLKSLALTILITSSPGLSLADDTANYRYAGDSTGQRVCRAVVHDDVKHFRQVLRFHRQTLVYGHRFSDQTLAGDFKCNRLGLADFAYQVNAHHVFGYLTTGKGTVEEQMVSIER